MSKPRKFFAGPWILVADPPPCTPGDPRRALAYCEKSRRGQRCACQFDLAAIAGDLEAVGLGEYASEFEDALDPDSLADVTAELLKRLRGLQTGEAVRVREEIELLQSLATEGSGVKPFDDD
jgi:hypothetical protein